MIIPTDSKLTLLCSSSLAFILFQVAQGPGVRYWTDSALLQLAEWCASLPLLLAEGKSGRIPGQE